MGIWPFSWRSKRKRTHGGGPGISRSEEEAMHHAGPLRDGSQGTEMNSTSLIPERRPSRRDSRGKRRSSRDTKKLQRNPQKQRTYSFSPGRHDSIQVAQDIHRPPPVPPLPTNASPRGVRANTVGKTSANNPVHPPRAQTQPVMSTQEWQRAPTLHKRTAQDLNRRKSNKKRRKEEHDREAEIKAMVAEMPTRPATDSASSGRPMKKDSRKMHTGLNHNFQNPASDISLPTAESMRSSLSSRSNDSASYKVSALDVLAPRPTIRCSDTPRYVPGASGFGSRGSGSPRRGISERLQIPKEVLDANKRVDDLADKLDAGDLRELMERDQRRKEKKKAADRMKMERRLARTQAKQRAEQAEAERTGVTPPPNMERGVLGRDGPSRETEEGISAVVTSSRRRHSDSSSIGQNQRRAILERKPSTLSIQDPRSHFKRTESLATEQQSPTDEHDEPMIGTAQVGTVSRASISPPPSPRDHTRLESSISQVMDLKEPEDNAPVKPGTTRRTSQSPVHPPQSWTSFFRRGTRTRKRGPTPSSFSNTSRDSMIRESHQTAQVPQIGYTPVKLPSNVPKRTMSKFREDLPELPISPPDSRVQSPEADEVPPIREEYPKAGHGSLENMDSRVRYDTPTSNYQSLDAMRLHDQTPTSGHRSMETASPEPTAIMSQSLASIDSEGSWLSGRKPGSKRASSQLMTHPLRDSASSLQKRYRELSESAEELGIAEDEYFSRLTPGPDDQFDLRRSSAQSGGQPVASSDEDDEEDDLASPKLGAVARRPTVIHHEPRAKSTYGLQEYLEGPAEETLDELSYGTNDDMNIDDPEAGLVRAKSVDLGHGHVRRISAGSARLLDLKPSLSGESSKNTAQIGSA
ncbi:hypothetical protein BP5796_05318 [Coleophoma crateriformis]|uniref:Uncharacterized protein n=1 Tax=Coleophoma crateriformis TaxID=565419 RepID=A0A3D8S380_9HELO|nr:hypothetical protein BP5796_05318 [Coleophoma crateriformis]